MMLDTDWESLEHEIEEVMEGYPLFGDFSEYGNLVRRFIVALQRMHRELSDGTEDED